MEDDTILIASISGIIIVTTIIIIFIVYYAKKKNNGAAPPVIVTQPPPVVVTQPPPVTCPKMTVVSTNKYWTDANWPNNQKILTNQCVLDDTSRAKYGQYYNSTAAQTYEILNPGCKAADNLIMPAGVSANMCGATSTENIFRASAPDPYALGSCVLNPDNVLNMDLLPGADTGARSYVCGVQKNQTDCNSLQGLTWPNGNALPKLCIWAPEDMAGKFIQKPVYYYPGTDTRDKFGPAQFAGRGTYGDGYVDWSTGPWTTAVNETCESVLQQAIDYIKPGNSVYIWSRVLPNTTDPTNKYKVVITEMTFASGSNVYPHVISWAPSKTITYVGGVAARQYVPVCYMPGYYNWCSWDADPTKDSWACGACDTVNLVARGVI